MQSGMTTKIIYNYRIVSMQHESGIFLKLLSKIIKQKVKKKSAHIICPWNSSIGIL